MDSLPSVVRVAFTALTITCLPAGAHAQPDRPTLSVLLQDDAGVPGALLDRARAEVTRLFNLVGIGLDWVDDVPSSNLRFRVALLTTWEPSDKRVATSVMGYTQTAPGVRGIRAYVFWRRVDRTAQSFRADPERVLAVAIAHEIGHMVLSDGNHAKSGLMRAPWDANDFRSASAGMLTFSKDSATRLLQQAEAEHAALSAQK
jgi:hypothetical protein